MTTLKRKTFAAGLTGFRLASRMLGKEWSSLVAANIAEKLQPHYTTQTRCGNITFYCPGSLPLWRAKTLLEKEPETIEWIESFKPNALFWDIGANVGVYSLYAAKFHPTAKICSFEPAIVNHNVLVRNIEANKLDNQISSYCVAFSDETKLASFNMGTTEIGSALHAFGEAKDWKGNTFVPAFRQAMLGFRIDDFIRHFQVEVPDYIKIDVDGIEAKIIEGARNTLANKRLKSLLIELDTQDNDAYQSVLSTITAAGLKLEAKLHAAVFDGGEFAQIYNHIFRRN